MKAFGLMCLVLLVLRVPVHAQVTHIDPDDPIGAATNVVKDGDDSQGPEAQYWKWIVILSTVGILEALPGESLTQEVWHSAIALKLAIVSFIVAAVGHIFFGWWK